MRMLMPVLYSFRRCPYAIRARLALRAAGVAVEIREVLLRDKPAALLAASSKGTVPVLVLPDGSVLDQSMDIMRWALGRHDPHGWLQAADGASLIECNDGPFKALLDRYKYARVDAAEPRDAAVALLLAPLEQQLALTPYLLCPRCSLADIALLPFVRQFAAVDADWFAQAAPVPRLRDWLQRLLVEIQFDAVMDKRPPWQP